LNISIEHYGDKMGDNNIVEAFEKKKFHLLVTLVNDSKTTKHQFVLNGKQAKTFRDQLDAAINDPVLRENGFSLA
jgi:hypothetical protein